MRNPRAALEGSWENCGEQKSKESVQCLREGWQRAVMGCRRVKAVCESLVRDGDLRKQAAFDGMQGSGSGKTVTPRLQDQHGGTGAQRPTGRDEPPQWEGIKGTEFSQCVTQPMECSPAGQTPQTASLGATTHGDGEASLQVLDLDGSNISNAGKRWQR